MSINLIAIPLLSNNQSVLAIYTICISLALFFRYTDFGFIAAGKKYAAEHVISLNYNLQLKFLGNSFSISFLISLILSVSIFIISFYPEYIISDLEYNTQYSYFASILLKTLSISSLFQVFSNYLNSLFEVNLKKYYCDVLSIFTASISLLVFYLIDKSNDDWILAYYISVKVIDFIFLILQLALIKSTFKIKPLEMVKNFRIRKTLINKSLKLSVTSIIISIAAVIFYELDNVFLAQNNNLTSISFYSIAALGPSIIKTIFSLLYSPFSPIFNYKKNELNHYKNYFKKVVVFFFPITFTGILIIVLFSEEIIYSYVGINYNNSILPFIYLCLAWSFSFIIYPTGIYLFSREFNKRIIFCGLFPVIIFWTINFYNIWNYGNISIEKFCLNKMFSNLSILPFYIYFLIKDNFIDFNLFIKISKSLFSSCLVILCFYFPYKYLLFNEKQPIGLPINILLLVSLMIIIKLVDLKVIKSQINLKSLFSIN